LSEGFARAGPPRNLFSDQRLDKAPDANHRSCPSAGANAAVLVVTV
jgi:hypothetical protein